LKVSRLPSDTDAPTPPPESGTVETSVRTALAEGRAFAAYDLASKGLTAGSQADLLHLLAATALVRSGAVEAARDELARTEIAHSTAKNLDPQSNEGLLLAEVLEEFWQATGQEDDRLRALEIRQHRANSNPGFADMARAALLTQAGDDRTDVEKLAHAALKRAVTEPGGEVEQVLDLVELALIIGDDTAAAQHLGLVSQLVADSLLKRAQCRRRLDALALQGIAVDPSLVELFDPPVLVVFAGTRLRLGEDVGFPAGREQPLAAAIADVLDQLKPAVAYGSAAAGSDLIFCEALLNSGTELNIILPFQRDSFRDRFVAPHGADWLKRYDHVLASAASVTEVCQEHYFGDDALLRFGNQVIDGTARLRGAALSSPPYLVAVWDYLAEPSPGSPNDFIDHWGDPARLRLIGLDELEQQTDDPQEPDAAPSEPATTHDPDFGDQRVASMLFADVVGFSKLSDDQLPLFWRFMKAVSVHMGTDAPAPRMINSWGDAIVTDHDRAMDAADYATALGNAVAAIDSRNFGLPERLKLRIGLHAGPIFEGDHPLTGQRVIYGGNVNRAARIEPITVPGRTYASEQFVAVLTAEESELHAEAQLAGQNYRPRFRCIYRGQLELPKAYGTQAVYEVERWRDQTIAQTTIEPGRQLHAILSNTPEEHQRLADLFKQMVVPVALSEDVISLFELAFDEIVTNICSYAWADAERHSIDVEIVVYEDRIEAVFSDDGVAFDPLSAPTAVLDLDIDERVAGGLGIHLVSELMDDLRYRRDGNHNRLTVVKNLAGAPNQQASEEQCG